MMLRASAAAGAVRVERDELAQVLQRLGEVALVQVGDAQLVVGLGPLLLIWMASR